MLCLKSKQIPLPVAFVVAHTFFPLFTKINNQFMEILALVSLFLLLTHYVKPAFHD